MPYVTEEVWSWWKDGSIHHASWPTAGEVAGDGDPALLDSVSTVLVAIRGAKSQAKVSMRAEITEAHFRGPAAALAQLRAVEADIRAVGRIVGTMTWTEAEGPVSVDVDLAPA
jgi:valyl-tRNA synthetase